jgi:hypothetical protein
MESNFCQNNNSIQHQLENVWKADHAINVNIYEPMVSSRK